MEMNSMPATVKKNDTKASVQMNVHNIIKNGKETGIAIPDVLIAHNFGREMNLMVATAIAQLKMTIVQSSALSSYKVGKEMATVILGASIVHSSGKQMVNLTVATAKTCRIPTPVSSSPAHMRIIIQITTRQQTNLNTWNVQQLAQTIESTTAFATKLNANIATVKMET